MMGEKILGILGGMGPLASLAFLRTIYECNLNGASEQAYPSIVLHSLSGVPDRTSSLLNDGGRNLEASLVRNLTALNAAGVAKIVICCFTSHTLLSRLPKSLTEKIVSLVDLTARELMVRKEKALLMASLGSYERRLFDASQEAVLAQEYIVVPEEKDRRFIHGLIYDHLKPGREVPPVYEAVRGLLDRYGLNSFIAACTEFHLLTRYMDAHAVADTAFVDPLFTIARHFEEILE
jgi:aspartate racemase